MSTIRPLATIAILAGLGVFLAQQINTPADTADQLTANWGDAPAFESGVAPPALESSSASLAPPLSGAPLDMAPPALAPPTPPQVTPTEGGLPPLPSLPSQHAPPIAAPVAPQFPADSTTQPPISQPTPPTQRGLSDEIPMPEEVAEADYNNPPADSIPATPLAGLPSAPPAENSRYGAASPGVPPLRTQPAPPAADPYQSYAPPAPHTATNPIPPEGPESYASLGQIPGPTEPSFRDALPAISQALARNELTRAHTLLSSWYGDPGLTPAERTKVNNLLSQLAGTVVYSTEHRMEPAYSVKPGDTLETIAQQYQVPWRLLAKINGVPSPDAIQPGQTLKVLRGPFGAVVDANNSELVLMIDGKYAGKFPVQLSGAAARDGAWRVAQKPEGSPSPLGSGGKQLVLTDPSGAGTVVIATGGGSPMERGRVSVASSDLDELHDILSVGSEVTIRR